MSEMDSNTPAGAAGGVPEDVQANTAGAAGDAAPAQPIQIVAQPSSPEEEKALIKSFEQETSAQGMQMGDTYYIVSTKWYKSWKEYVIWDPYYRSSIQSPKPGPIENEVLIEAGSEPGDEKIRKTCMENYDYVIVSPKTWFHWQSWYGGGPALPRKVISSGWGTNNYIIEVRLLSLRVHKSSSINDSIVVNVSKSTTIGQFKKDMCAKFGLNEDDVRVWDYHANNKYKLLEDLKVKMDQAQIIDGQPMLLEEKGPDGKFPEAPKPRTYTSGGGYSYYYNASHTGGPTDPGTTGLINLGNTCFMNSSLQCLSQTPPLVKYLLQDKYKDEINETNPLGMKGELAEAYASLVKLLWSGNHSAVAPREFKGTLERFAPQFAGYQQHDSQELLAFLLDGLHEDLNRIKTKPYTENPEVDDRPQDVVAKEAWDRHRSRNDSIIVDWFQGQLRSTLVCPKCDRVSITFDPFMYLSLPLPMKNTRIIYVNMFFADANSVPVRYGVEVNKFSTVKELVMTLAQMTGVRHDSIVITDVYNSKFFKQYHEKESLDNIQDRDNICAYELDIGDADADIKHFPIILRRDEVVSHPYHPHGSYTRKTLFGFPFVLSVRNAANITYRDLYDLVYIRLKRFFTKFPSDKIIYSTADLVPPSEQQQNDDTAKAEVMDQEQPQQTQHQQQPQQEQANSDDSDSDSDIDSDDSDDNRAYYHNKQHQNNSSSSNAQHGPQPIFRLKLINDNYGGSDSVNLVDNNLPLNLDDRAQIAVIFTEEMAEEVYDDQQEKNFRRDASCQRGDENDSEGAVGLDKCLDLFTLTEKLGPEDPWYCSKCKEFQQATKKFDLWKLPPILVIHLKRFSYKNKYWREKLETLVEYPIHDLDLSAYVKGPQEVPPTYELYAVSNHYGSLGGGHYTAYGKNKDNGKWYKFDDSSVSQIDESKAQTSSGYVLFYRRKDTIEANEGTSATTTTSNNNNNNDANGDSSSDSDDDQVAGNGNGNNVEMMDTEETSTHN